MHARSVRRPGYLGGYSAPVVPTVHDRVTELRRKLVQLAEEAQVIEQQIVEAEMQAVFVDYAKTCRVVLRVDGDAAMTEAVLDSLTRSTQSALGMPLTVEEWCDALKRYTPADVDDVDGPMRASFERTNVRQTMRIGLG
jgi:hypothetical protein